jgi:hypothetical protein
LTDYAGINPCTRIRTSPTLVDITPGRLTYNQAWQVFYQGGASQQQNHGPTAPSDGVYDGVIVRSPWVRRPSQPTGSNTIAGDFQSNVPRPTRMASILDGASNTIMVSEKYIHVGVYAGGSWSDDRGWADGWDPDIMRCTCVPPLNDGDVNPQFTGDPPGFGGPETFVLGSAHTGGFNCVRADGSVHGIDYGIDVFVLNAMGTRNGGEVVNQ